MQYFKQKWDKRTGSLVWGGEVKGPSCSTPELALQTCLQWRNWALVKKSGESLNTGQDLTVLEIHTGEDLPLLSPSPKYCN